MRIYGLAFILLRSLFLVLSLPLSLFTVRLPVFSINISYFSLQSSLPLHPVFFFPISICAPRIAPLYFPATTISALLQCHLAPSISAITAALHYLTLHSSKIRARSSTDNSSVPLRRDKERGRKKLCASSARNRQREVRVVALLALLRNTEEAKA